jgi:hypothetical protein
VLESVLLISCFAILLGGAIFKSAQFTEGDAMHWVLTVAVAGTVIGAMGLFAWMTVAEVRRAFTVARRRDGGVEHHRGATMTRSTWSPWRARQLERSVRLAERSLAGAGGPGRVVHNPMRTGAKRCAVVNAAEADSKTGKPEAPVIVVVNPMWRVARPPPV